MQILRSKCSYQECIQREFADSELRRIEFTLANN